MSADEIPGVPEENRESLRRPGVKRLGLFGSAVRGEMTPESDLDFLVEFERKSFDADMDFEALLETLRPPRPLSRT